MSDNKQELAPCPFCGKDGIVLYNQLTDRFKVGCSNKHCPVRPRVLSYDRADAIAAWNWREGGKG